MFWERFYELCCNKNTKPNPVGQELGISSGILTKWKAGTSYPNGDNLIKIAKYFNCSIDYLVGLVDNPNSHFNKVNTEDIEILEKLNSLPSDSREEIIHILEYKYNKLQGKKETILSHSSSNQSDNRFA